MDLDQLKSEFLKQRNDQAPEGYFDDLASRSWDRNRQRSVHKIRVLWWQRIGSAAAIALLFWLVSMVWEGKPVRGEQIISGLSPELQVAYYLHTSDANVWTESYDWVDDMTEEEYWEVMMDEDLSFTEIDY